MKRLNKGEWILIGMTAITFAFCIAWSYSNYTECRAHEFSRLYCANHFVR